MTSDKLPSIDDSRISSLASESSGPPTTDTMHTDESLVSVEELICEISVSSDKGGGGVEELLRDIMIMRMQSLKDTTVADLNELTARQQEVENLHKLLARINEATDKDGKVKMTDALLELLQGAVKNDNNSSELNILKMDPKELKILEKGKVYSTQDRQRLYENIRSHIETLQTKNDMQLQSLTQAMNERYETYQLARSIMKPSDEDKKNKARAIAGR